MMPSMLKMAFLVHTVELLGVQAHNQNGVFSDVDIQSRVSILVPK